MSHGLGPRQLQKLLGHLGRTVTTLLSGRTEKIDREGIPLIPVKVDVIPREFVDGVEDVGIVTDPRRDGL